MDYAAFEVQEFVKANDVKFIRLSFVDLFGTQKNVSILPSELPRAFEDGISFDASAIWGFSDVSHSDLFLVPDPTTLHVLPWRPSQGRVVRLYCDIRKPDGSPFPFDTRRVLARAVDRCKQAGFRARFGAECEFYLFRLDEQGYPTLVPHDRGGYLDVAPLDRGENVRREICLTLEEFGLTPEASHHEQGPGQNEIDFRHSEPLSAADSVITFKNVVRAVAERNGLYASFDPKPLPDAPGSGLHVNLSLSRDGRNLFDTPLAEGSRAPAASCISGLLRESAAICIFGSPQASSYTRLGRCEAPRYISWSPQNRSQLIRIPAAAGDAARMELRSPDPSCNPYLLFTLILHAALDGIEEGLVLPAPVNENLYRPDAPDFGLAPLPETLSQAVDIARKSSLPARALGAELARTYLDLKAAESSSAV
ncbi:MAG: glutamine synthetase family protein [Clostridiaceae bacterium]|nr:glutamine synthetase family protein [Clostridiaceae bacterium]